MSTSAVPGGGLFFLSSLTPPWCCQRALRQPNFVVCIFHGAGIDNCDILLDNLATIKIELQRYASLLLLLLMLMVVLYSFLIRSSKHILICSFTQYFCLRQRLISTYPGGRKESQQDRDPGRLVEVCEVRKRISPASRTVSS